MSNRHRDRKYGLAVLTDPHPDYVGHDVYVALLSDEAKEDFATIVENATGVNKAFLAREMADSPVARQRMHSLAQSYR